MANRFTRNLPVIIIAGIVVFFVGVKLMFYFGVLKNKYTPLPYYGNKTLDTKGDTVYHTVPPFSFTDQHGKPFGSDQLKGNVYVAQFFFTSCPTICPPMTKNVKTVYEAFHTVKDFHVVGFTLDPKRDSPATLRKFAAKYSLPEDRWHLLTGKRESIYDLMNQSGFLLLKPEPNEDPYRFRHTEIVVLVDKEGHIRGMYDATKDDDVKRLTDEVRVLLLSYAEHHK